MFERDVALYEIAEKSSIKDEPLAKLKTTKYPSNLLAYFQRNFEATTAKPVVFLS